MVATTPLLRFIGHKQFRSRLVLAALSQKAVRISSIRCSESDKGDPGLTDHELSFLELLKKITTATVDIVHDGTAVIFTPGVMKGGNVKHVCPTTRAVGWFLEWILILAPFCQLPLELTLIGITNDNTSPSVDTIKKVHLPLFKHFGVPVPTLTIESRGATPDGRGRVVFSAAPASCALVAPRMTTQASITHIRGVACSTNLSTSIPADAAEAAKALLSRYTPDTTVTVCTSNTSENTPPGYALTLVAYASPHTILSASCAFQPRTYPTDSSSEDEIADIYTYPPPENLGIRTSRLLLQEIRKGGCVDKTAQGMVVALLALAKGEGSVRIGAVEGETGGLIKDLKMLLGVEVRVKADLKTRTVLLNCVGIDLRGGEHERREDGCAA